MTAGDSEVVDKTLCPSCAEQGFDWDADNLVLYSDGHGYCFACGHYQAPPENQQQQIKERSNTIHQQSKRNKKPSPLIDVGGYRSLKARGLSEATCAKFGYSVGAHDGRTVQIAPYYNHQGKLVAQHLRYPDKDFRWRGDSSSLQLFGQHLWAKGKPTLRIVITEGEIDAMTISQLQDNKWPVVSIPSGADSALKYLKQNLEYLESYGEVVLAFDMDEAGRKAAEECAPLFTLGKCKVAHLPAKDANEAFQGGKSKELMQSLWSAQAYRPDGIINGQDLYDKCKKPPQAGLELPFPELQEKTLGIRSGELWLFTAGSGLGKSTMANEIGFHLHQQFNQPLGIMALEESTERNGRRYLGMYTNKLLHLPGTSLSDQEYDEAFKATIGRGDWWIYEHFGSTNIDNLLQKIRYMTVALGVRFLILDHISIIVSGLSEADGDNERKTIDILMTKLRSLIEETGLTVIAIVHLKRKGDGKSFNEGRQVSLTDLRGSGSLEQLSDVVIALERDQQGDYPNFAHIRVLKNRPTGNCGPAGGAEYNAETGRLLAADHPEETGEAMGFEASEDGKINNDF